MRGPDHTAVVVAGVYERRDHSADERKKPTKDRNSTTELVVSGALSIDRGLSKQSVRTVLVGRLGKHHPEAQGDTSDLGQTAAVTNQPVRNERTKENRPSPTVVSS
jgi:hypothetical protein